MRDNRLVRKKAAGKGNDQCYASGVCQGAGPSETQVVFCPKCKKKHYSAYRVPGVRPAPDSYKVYFDLRQALEVHEGRTKPAY